MAPSMHAVVVGGTKGLGRVVAERFLQRGCAVTVLSRNRPQALDGICHVSVDLETLTDAAALAQEVVVANGSVRYLVFCQRYRGNGDQWAGEFQVSLTATRLITESLADHFCDDGDRAQRLHASTEPSSTPDGRCASSHFRHI